MSEVASAMELKVSRSRPCRRADRIFFGGIMKTRPIAIIVWMLAFPLETRAASQDDWAPLMAKGRDEGVVVIGTNVGNPAFREGLAVFQKRFGIKVDLRTQRSAETDAILIRECGVGRPTIDVTIGGNGDTVYRKGCFAPIKSHLILPEVVDSRNWRGGLLKFNDPKREYLFETIQSVYGWIIVNSDQIKAKELVSAKDLLKPQYRGKITAFDPRTGGAGQNVASYLLHTLGDDYIKNLFLGQKVVYTRDYQQLGEWIARGVYAIGLGGTARGIEGFRKEGLPLKVVQLEDLAFVAGSVGVLRLTKDRPHPNATTVFLNWFASKEGQQLFSRAIGEPSRRIDVSMSEVPDYLIPNPSFNYFDTYEHEYNFVQHPLVQKKLEAILGR
jgi:ABC-type Fe3+ transport system substrate-binding protein